MISAIRPMVSFKAVKRTAGDSDKPCSCKKATPRQPGKKITEYLGYALDARFCLCSNDKPQKPSSAVGEQDVEAGETADVE